MTTLTRPRARFRVTRRDPPHLRCSCGHVQLGHRSSGVCLFCECKNFNRWRLTLMKILISISAVAIFYAAFEILRAIVK